MWSVLLDVKGAQEMLNNTIAKTGEQLALLGVKFSQGLPQFILDEARVSPWLNLSLATIYLAFAKHWLPFFPDQEIARALDRCVDTCFFEFLQETSFDVKVSDVILHVTERDIYCKWADISPSAFAEHFSDTQTLLKLVFPTRCNQYSADLRAGIVAQLEGTRGNVLGPVIFAYKRFNQHVYGVACDEGTIDLEESLKYIFPLSSILMDAVTATETFMFEAMGRLL
jgi:hypothetical protein